MPQRQVYICEHSSYDEATRQEFQKFQQKLFQFKERFNSITIGDQEQYTLLSSEIEAAINETCANIMDKIQIEPGRYTLTMSVTYRQKRKHIPVFITKKTESKVQLEVEEYARNFMRYSLKEYLKKKAYQFLSDKKETIAAPEYSPSNVIELTN